ncbi:hypothetical protein Tco_1370319 [Tanacetum coccineum]
MISLTVPSPIVSPVATLTSTIFVDEDRFIEVGAQLESHRSILHDHTQRLDTMSPTLFAGIDKDVRDLYIRSGVHATLQHELQKMRGRVTALEQERDHREW